MLHRSRVLVALFPLVAFTACDDDPASPPADQATVRFANATTLGIDVDNGGAAAGTNLGFAGTTSCLAVNTAADAASSLAFRQAGSGNLIVGFSQNFVTGGEYTVVAYPGFSGNVQFLTLEDGAAAPASGQAGVRVLNGAPGSGNLVLWVDGEVVGSAAGAAYGTAGTFGNVAAGSRAFTVTSGGATVATTGAFALSAGGTYTLVVAPPDAGSSELRTFIVPGC